MNNGELRNRVLENRDLNGWKSYHKLAYLFMLGAGTMFLGAWRFYYLFQLDDIPLRFLFYSLCLSLGITLFISSLVFGLIGHYKILENERDKRDNVILVIFFFILFVSLLFFLINGYGLEMSNQNQDEKPKGVSFKEGDELKIEVINGKIVLEKRNV